MAECEGRMASQESHARSSISVSTYTFCWSIENLLQWPRDSPLTSPTFYPEPGREFYATLQEYENNSNYNNLCYHQKSGSEINMIFKVTVMDSTAKVQFSETEKKKTMKTGTGIEFYFDRSAIAKYNLDSKGKVLIFKCFIEMRRFKTEYDSLLRKREPMSELDNISALARDLKVMHVASSYTDVSLRVEDGTEVRANKSILCVRSPVFARMFETPMGETHKNVVDITDLKLQVLKDLLEFVYTGSLRDDHDFESVFDLYYAADKYDVQSLRATCVDVLLSKLEVGNACRMLSLAERHSDEELRNSAMHFIDFYWEEILESEAWDDFVECETRLALVLIRYHKRKVKSDS